MKRTLAATALLAIGAGITIATHGLVTAAPLANCSAPSTGYAAITDLGPRTYRGEQGGLYPGGSNVPPAAYQTLGIQAARAVMPLDRSGKSASAGKILFISIGMSNTTMEFSSFARSEIGDVQRNPQVAFVDGAQGRMTAVFWANPADATWSVLEQRLTAAGYTDQQVQVAWIKEADFARPPSPPDFETYAHSLTQELIQITSNAARKFPHLREVFVSARSYGGYSVLGLGPNPEPWAYETGFADKWFVAQSIAKPNQTPWVGWGPYFWTDGARGRNDGLRWLCSDTVDGTHPSATGLAKINALMHAMFTSSVFTPWFVGPARIRTA